MAEDLNKIVDELQNEQLDEVTGGGSGSMWNPRGSQTGSRGIKEEVHEVL